MYRALYIGFVEDDLQKLDDLREGQLLDPRCNTLHSTGNGAEPVGSFLTFSFSCLLIGIAAKRRKGNPCPERQ